MGAVANSSDLILFIDGLHEMVDASRKSAGQALRGVLQFALQEAEVRCVGATTEEEYKAACAVYPGLDKAFRPLHVRPLNAAAALEALTARKKGLEEFHEVVFTDDALQCAVEQVDSYLKEKLLPGKGLELLDTAGAAVRVREGAAPTEIIAIRTKLRFIRQRMDTSIANHEFEKARFYSEEERKERLNLAALREEHGLQDATAPAVTRADVEQAIQKLNAYPYDRS